MQIKGLEPETNLRHMSQLIERIADSGRADLVVFPELANSGYIKLGDKHFDRDFFRCAEPIPGPFTDRLVLEAQKYASHLIVGLLEAHPRIPHSLYNSAVLIAPTGDILGISRKIHLPLPERNFFYPGGQIKVFPTELGNVAMQVCADGAFPELSRILALKGAEIVCTLYNMPDMPGRYFEERIVHSACCRAMENMNFYVACNRVGEDSGGSFVGRTCIAGPYGQLLGVIDSTDEEILNVTLRDEMLAEARSYSPYLSYRRPELYGTLTEL